MVKNRLLIFGFLLGISTTFLGCFDDEEPSIKEGSDTIATNTIKEEFKNTNTSENANIDKNTNSSVATKENTENKTIETDKTKKQKEEQIEVATETINNTEVREEKKANKKDNIEQIKVGESGNNGVRSWVYEDNLSKETFWLINVYRKENGVQELKWNEKEWERANTRALENVQEEKGGHEFEQISILTGFDSTAKEFLNRWKNSPSHNKFLLNNKEEEGAVVVYRDSNNIYYIVASFIDNWEKGEESIGTVPFGNF